MPKTIASFVFAILLVSLTVAPTLAIVFDCSYEVSLLLDGEEEETEGNEGSKEASKDKELKLFQDLFPAYNMQSEQLCLAESYYSKLYSSNHKELASPPPEQYTI